MNTAPLLAIMLMGITWSAGAALLCPPTSRLAGRVRPYTVVPRSRLHGDPDVADALGSHPEMGMGVLNRLFGPPFRSLAVRLGRVVESRSDDVIAVQLYQAGLVSVTPEEYRTRQLL